MTIRFSDQDAVGHVNNVAFAAYVEAGRSAFFAEVLRPLAEPDRYWVLARVAIDYLKQINYPGEVRVGTRAIRAGASSLVIGVGVFMDGEPIATAENVSVHWDTKNNRKAQIGQRLREALFGTA